MKVIIDEVGMDDLKAVARVVSDAILELEQHRFVSATTWRDGDNTHKIALRFLKLK